MQLTTSRTQWGLSLFDDNYQGLPSRSFNLLETTDKFSELLGIALFINTGLENGQYVTLVTFDSPENVLARFTKLGFDFSEVLQLGHFSIVSYKSTFTHSLNISTDYQALFTEIRQLGHDKTARYAFLNADLLFNLESYSLATVSVSKISEAASAVEGTVLAQFTTVDSPAHQRLRNVCASLLNCYLVISRSTDNKMSLEVKTYH